MERKQFGSRFSYDGYLQSCHHTSMPSGSNKFPQEKQSNAKPDSSDKRAYFTVHTRGDENVLKRGKRTLEELNHPSSISLLYIQEKSEKSEKYGNKDFFFCESLIFEDLGYISILNPISQLKNNSCISTTHNTVEPKINI